MCIVNDVSSIVSPVNTEIPIHICSLLTCNTHTIKLFEYNIYISKLYLLFNIYESIFNILFLYKYS